MINALANSFAPISGSSVTTIVGLLALVFMKFKIGQDMGIVLAKGVFLSLVCIFTLLLGVVVSLDKLIEKSKKKSLNVPMKRVMRFVTKAGAVIMPAAIVLACVSYVSKDDVKVGFFKVFDNEDQTYIEECFGLDNQTVLLYKNTETPETVKTYIEWLEQRDDVNSVQDYSNTLGVSYSPEEIAVQFGFEKAQAEMMFKMSGKDTMTTSEFLSAASMMLSQTEGSEEMLAQLKAAQETMDENRRQMLGKDYNRMIVSIKHESEGDSSFNAIGELIDKADDTFSDSNYFVGDSVMGKEMNDEFKKELNFVTLLTIIAIFIVVLFTFRSILSSAILVIVIQSAVYSTYPCAVYSYGSNY